jgi:hypothetical protein
MSTDTDAWSKIGKFSFGKDVCLNLEYTFPLMFSMSLEPVPKQL